MDSTRKAADTQSFHAGYVAIIGKPNAGKSTLMNALIGQKLSIVTNKPQTTRHKIIGIFTEENFQIVFLDTPGLIQPKYLLHQSMMRAVEVAIADADVVLFMIDCTSPGGLGDSAQDAAIEVLRGLDKPVYLVVNKIDVVTKQVLAEIIAVYANRYSFKEVFPISALTLEGTAELLQHLVMELPDHPPFYSTESVSEQSERFFVSEIIREKIFETFREEIPYSTTVEIIDFKERKGRKDVIEAEIYVERDSQKGILIGKKGTSLKDVGERARQAIEEFLQRPVFLNLHVKVKNKWRDQEVWLKRFGYK